MSLYIKKSTAKSLHWTPLLHKLKARDLETLVTKMSKKLVMYLSAKLNI